LCHVNCKDFEQYFINMWRRVTFTGSREQQQDTWARTLGTSTTNDIARILKPLLPHYSTVHTKRFTVSPDAISGI